MAVFSRRRLELHDLNWLRVFADHAAVAIANARAFEEIERLKERAERERDYLREAVRSALQEEDLVAVSPAMRRVLEQAERVSQTDSSILILGESGVGKELIAAAIHRMSPRRDESVCETRFGLLEDAAHCRAHRHKVFLLERASDRLAQVVALSLGPLLQALNLLERSRVRDGNGCIVREDANSH